VTRRIDAWTHILPDRYFARLRARHSETGRLKRWLTLPSLFDLDLRFRLMDEFADYSQVLTLSMPPIEELAEAAEAAELAHIANDGMAELTACYPERFAAFVGALSLLDPQAAVREVERAVRSGARGFQIPTHIHGRPLDAPEFSEVFAAIAAAGVPIWLHPSRGPDFADYAAETLSRYEIWWCFGWPYETSAAMARLVFSGMFDRHPDLKVLTHHMGAMIPFFSGRIVQGWGRQMGTRTADAERALLPADLKRPPIEYFREFYGDTSRSGDVSAMRCGLEFFGANHVIFASDFPFDAEGGPWLVRETLRGLDQLGLVSSDREMIERGNILRLLNLSYR
jgi:aminocarboxymuconate-semialdehyde decarboxylase